MATSKNSSSTSAVSVRPHVVCQYSHCDTTVRTLPSTWSLPLASIVSDNTYVPSSHSNPQQNNCAWCGVQTSPRRVSRGREKITFAKSPRRHCVGLLRPALSYSRRVAIDAAADAAREDRRRVAEPGVLSEARDTGVG